MKLQPFIAALFILPLAAAAQGESALRQQHEKELETARAALAGFTQKAAASDAANPEYAGALKAGAIALNLLGRSDEALAQIKEAAKFAPDDPGVKMQTAVILDYLGKHDEAGAIYDELFQTIRDWQADRVKARKAGNMAKLSPAEEAILNVSISITANAAINNAFRNKPDHALAQFTRAYESRSTVAGAGRHADSVAGWRLWLTARVRADNGMHADAAVEYLGKTLRVSAPCHKELVQLWVGKGHWKNILSALDGMSVSDAEKETLRTQAHFLAAGYYRYIKNDSQTALELLDAENARPFNGCVERLFIRREIAELRK